MKTVLYADRRLETGMPDIGGSLTRIIRELIPGITVTVCDSISGLSDILCRPLNRVSVVILMVGSRKELIEFNFMIPLFENARVIIVLPDRDERTRALCFKLSPSFVSYADNDLNDVVAVLGQIRKKQ